MSGTVPAASESQAVRICFKGVQGLTADAPPHVVFSHPPAHGKYLALTSLPINRDAKGGIAPFLIPRFR